MVAAKKAVPRKPRGVPAHADQQIWGGLQPGDLVVVDSAPLIYLLEDHPKFAVRFEGLFELQAQRRVRVAISTISLAEVLIGPLKHKQVVLAKRYEKSLSDFEVVPVTQEIAVTAARIRAGTGLKLPDALQAATAVEISATALVTHDRDFSKLQGLRVLDGTSTALL